MAIKLRTDQSVELTYQEADENFSSLFYSASIAGTTLSLYYTGSSFAPSINPVNISLPEGTRWTSSLNGSISRDGDISVVGSISATGAITGSGFKIIGGNINQIITAGGTVLTAGTNITISGGTISATDTNTTYTAGTGLTLTGTTFALADQPLHYKKMVPYTVVEYYGSLTAFDSTGAGTGDWTKIYLCNGNNGTPDKRGVVGVGVTDGSMKGGTMASAVAPGGGNPTYTFNTITGANTVTLNVTQVPAHDHTVAGSVTIADHYHYAFTSTAISNNGPTVTSATSPSSVGNLNDNLSYRVQGGVGTPTLGRTSGMSGGSGTIDTTSGTTGGGQAHSNYQPGLGCYYIMYIPS